MSIDKPLECAHCVEPCAIIYKQLRGTQCIAEALCKSCPLLKMRQEGDASLFDHHLDTLIACHTCGTHLQEVLCHQPLGCEHCYEVFKEAICRRLNCKNLEYTQDHMTHKNMLPTSEQLLKLSKDLQEAVVAENFEKAALLRDEINKLKKITNES